MAQVDDRHDVAPVEFAKGRIGKFPVMLASTGERRVQRRAIAQEGQAKLLHQTKILLPSLIMAAPRHLVDADAARP
jgi:hypothetical protein